VAFFTSIFASVGIFSDTARAIQNSHLLDPHKTFALRATTFDRASQANQTPFVFKKPGLIT
jgi:hypothetical protein